MADLAQEWAPDIGNRFWTAEDDADLEILAEADVRELSVREIAGGGIVRAIYDFRTNTPSLEYFRDTDSKGIVWLCEADEVLDQMEHLFADPRKSLKPPGYNLGVEYE